MFVKGQQSAEIIKLIVLMELQVEKMNFVEDGNIYIEVNSYNYISEFISMSFLCHFCGSFVSLYHFGVILI